jgi:hypothetical protein
MALVRGLAGKLIFEEIDRTLAGDAPQRLGRPLRGSCRIALAIADEIPREIGSDEQQATPAAGDATPQDVLAACSERFTALRGEGRARVQSSQPRPCRSRIRCVPRGRRRRERGCVRGNAEAAAEARGGLEADDGPACTGGVSRCLDVSLVRPVEYQDGPLRISGVLRRYATHAEEP